MIGTSLPPRRLPCTGSFPFVPLSDLTPIYAPAPSPLCDHLFSSRTCRIGSECSFFPFLKLLYWFTLAVCRSYSPGGGTPPARTTVFATRRLSFLLLYPGRTCLWYCTSRGMDVGSPFLPTVHLGFLYLNYTLRYLWTPRLDHLNRWFS